MHKHTEYSRVLREELRASHMTRYTSLQGLINIFNFSLLFDFKLNFAKPGCGNVSTTGFYFNGAEYNHESTPSPTVLCHVVTNNADHKVHHLPRHIEVAQLWWCKFDIDVQISILVSTWMTSHPKKAHHKFQDPKVTSLNCLFYWCSVVFLSLV